MYGGMGVRILVGTVAYVGIALAAVPMIRRSELAPTQKASVACLMILGLV